MVKIQKMFNGVRVIHKRYDLENTGGGKRNKRKQILKEWKIVYFRKIVLCH